MYPKKLDLNKEEKIGGLEKVTMPEKVCYNQAIDQFTKEIKKRAEGLERYFKNLRFHKDHHLGSGDIRLTIGQQEEIIKDIIEGLEKK
jgi:hypothetical protein